MQLKDEELALSISAERLEGYEVEGINEEVDKVKKILRILRKIVLIHLSFCSI